MASPLLNDLSARQNVHSHGTDWLFCDSLDTPQLLKHYDTDTEEQQY
jgi:hypothetical protein